MNKKTLILLFIFVGIILIFVLWISSMNNESKVIPIQKQEGIKVEEKAKEPVFNTDIIEQNDVNQAQQEGPIAI